MPLPTQQQGSFVPDRPNKPPRKPRKPKPSAPSGYSYKPPPPQQSSSSYNASRSNDRSAKTALRQYAASTKSYKPPRVTTRNYFETQGIGGFLRNLNSKFPDMDLSYMLNQAIETRFNTLNTQRDINFNNLLARQKRYYSGIEADAYEGEFPDEPLKRFKTPARQVPTERMFERDYWNRVNQPGITAEDASAMGYTLGANIEGAQAESEDRGYFRSRKRQMRQDALQKIDEGYDFKYGPISEIVQALDAGAQLAKPIKRQARRFKESQPTWGENTRPDLMHQQAVANKRANEKAQADYEAEVEADLEDDSFFTRAVKASPWMRAGSTSEGPPTAQVALSISDVIDEPIGVPIDHTIDKLSRPIYGVAAGAKAFYDLNNQTGGDENRGFVNKVLANNFFLAPATFAFGENPADVVDDLSPSGIGKVASATAGGLWGGGPGMHDNPTLMNEVIASNARDNPDQSIHDSKKFQTGMGLALDVTMDPLNLFGFGLARSAVSSASLTAKLGRSTAAEAARRGAAATKKAAKKAGEEPVYYDTEGNPTTFEGVGEQARQAQKNLEDWESGQGREHPITGNKGDDIAAAKADQTIEDVKDFFERTVDEGDDTPVTSKTEAIEIMTGRKPFGYRRPQSPEELAAQTREAVGAYGEAAARIDARTAKVPMPNAAKYAEARARYTKQRDDALAQVGADTAVDKLRGFFADEIQRGNRKADELDEFETYLQTESVFEKVPKLQEDLRNQYIHNENFKEKYGIDLEKVDPTNPAEIEFAKEGIPEHLHEDLDADLVKLEEFYDTYKSPAEHLGIEHMAHLPLDVINSKLIEMSKALFTKPSAVKSVSKGRTFKGDTKRSTRLHYDIEAKKEHLKGLEEGSYAAEMTVKEIQALARRKGRLDARKNRLYAAMMIRGIRDELTRGTGETLFKDVKRAEGLKDFRDAALARLGKTEEDLKGGGYFDTTAPETAVYFEEEGGWRGAVGKDKQGMRISDEEGLDPTTNPEAFDETNIDVGDLPTGTPTKVYPDWVGNEGKFDLSVVEQATPPELKRMVNYATRELDTLNTVNPTTGKIQGFSDAERDLLRHEAPDSLVDAEGNLDVDKAQSFVNWNSEKGELEVTGLGSRSENEFMQEVLDIVNENTDEAFDVWQRKAEGKLKRKRDEAVDAIIEQEVKLEENPFAGMIEETGGTHGGSLKQKAFVIDAKGKRIHEGSSDTSKLITDEDVATNKRFDALEKTLKAPRFEDDTFESVYRDNYQGDDVLTRNINADFAEFRDYLRQEGMVTPTSLDDFAEWFRGSRDARNVAHQIIETKNIAFNKVFQETHGITRLDAKHKATVGRSEMLIHNKVDEAIGRGYDLERSQFEHAFRQGPLTMRYLYENYDSLTMGKQRGFRSNDSALRKEIRESDNPEKVAKDHWNDQWEMFKNLSRGKQEQMLYRIWTQSTRSRQRTRPLGLRGNAEKVAQRKTEIKKNKEFQKKNRIFIKSEVKDAKRKEIAKKKWDDAIRGINENKLFKSVYDEQLTITGLHSGSSVDSLLEVLKFKHGEERAAAVRADIEAAQITNTKANKNVKRRIKRNDDNLKNLEVKHKEELAAFKAAKKEAEEAKVVLKQRIYEDSLLKIIGMPMEHMAAGFTLRTMGKEIKLPGSQQLIAAVNHATQTVPFLRASRQKYADAFTPPSAHLSPTSQAARAQMEGLTPLIIEDHIKELEKRVGHIPVEDRKGILNLINTPDMGKASWAGDPAHYDAVYDVINDLLPYFKQEKIIGEDPLIIKEIAARLPRPFAPRGKQNLSPSSFQTPYDLMKMFWHKKEPKTKENPSGYTHEELKKLEDPLEIAWTIRVAAEGALAVKAMAHNISEGFGVRRVYASRNDGTAIRHKKNLSDQGDAIEDLTKLGWQPIKELGNTNYLFPKEVVPEIKRLIDSLHPRNIERLEKIMDQALRVWKTSATIYNPGYWTRNVMGEVWAGFIGGVYDPRYYGRAANVMKFARKDGKTLDAVREQMPLDSPRSTSVKGSRHGVRLQNGEVMSIEEVFLTFGQTGGRTGFINTEVGRNLAAGRGRGLSKPGIREVIKGHRGIRTVGENMEDWLRLAHYMHALEHAGPKAGKKAAAEKAAWEVRKYHFDYTDFTDFEKMVMLRLFPFYKWTRKALPLYATTLFTKPGKALAYPKVANAASNYLTTGDMSEDENGFAPTYEGIIPSFIQDMWAYQIMMNEDRNPVFLNVQNPTSDAQRYTANPLGQSYAMLNPFLKVPLEQLMPGGIANNDQGSSMGSTLGGGIMGGYRRDLSDPKKENERLSHLMSFVPAAKLISEATGFANEGEGIASERGTSFGTGIGLYEVDEDQRWGTLFGEGYDFEEAARRINQDKYNRRP